MQTKQFGLLIGLCVSAIAGCSSPASQPPLSQIPQAGASSGTAGAPTGTGGSGTAGASPAGGGAAGAAPAGGGAAGAAPAGGGAAGAAPAGGGAAGASPAGGGAAGAGTAGGGSTLPTMSAGCGKTLPPLVTPGAFAELFSQPMPNGSGGTTPPPMMVPCDAADDTADSYPPCVNGMKKRGFFVYVKAGFDNTKPSKVVYQAAGCDDGSAAQGGKASYAFQTADAASAMQVIQVGMEYSRKDECYDNTNPKSNDFKLFPLLHKYIEDNFCVDQTKEYFSGYSSGAWVANQFTCALPDVLHAVLEATGSEPMMQPTCVQGHPVAGLFLHDKLDMYNTYDSVIPACTRLLKQNGCATTTCDPTSAANTVAYPVPTGLGTPQSMSCVSFKGCIAAPVIFCTTQLNTGDMQAHYIGQDSWITKFFWDFINTH